MMRKFIFTILSFLNLLLLDGCILALASPESCKVTASCQSSNSISDIIPLFLSSNEENVSDTSEAIDGANISSYFFYPNSVYFFAIGDPVTISPESNALPFTNCSISPPLPSDLHLNPTSCVIYGVPASVTGNTLYEVTASNVTGSFKTFLTILIYSVGSAPSLSYIGSPFTWSQNATISTLTPTLSGSSPTSCTSSPSLPTGITIHNTSCVISGTPTGTQVATNHVITATNTYGLGQRVINIRVNAAGVAPSISYTGSPYTFTQNTSISSLTPALTGNAPTSCTASPSLPAGLSIHNTTCIISGTPTGTQVSTNHVISATNGFGTGQATINVRVNAAPVSPTISYSGSPFSFTQNSPITTLSASLTGNTPTSCTASPTLPTGLSIHATTCAISGTPTGTQIATSHTVTATNGAGNGTTSIQITVGATPTLSYAGSPFTLTQNSPITTINASLTGNALTSCTSSPSLPTGLSIDNTTCDISGTPTGTQTPTNHTITATNAYGNATAILNIRVDAPTSPPTLSYPESPFTLPVGANPIPSWTVNLTGTPLTSCVSTPSLPSGFSLSNSTCQITGTATASFSATNFTIRATNAYGFVDRVISITATP